MQLKGTVTSEVQSRRPTSFQRHERLSLQLEDASSCLESLDQLWTSERSETIGKWSPRIWKQGLPS